MFSVLPTINIHKNLEDFRLPALLKYFKKHEGKDFDNEIDITQCETQYGLYLYGKITLLKEIINKEI